MMTYFNKKKKRTWKTCSISRLLAELAIDKWVHQMRYVKEVQCLKK
jgi:hypothetical protein